MRMLAVILQMLIIGFLLSSVELRAELSQTAFADAFKRFYGDSQLLPNEENREKHKDTVFVLVKGFGGDEQPVSYFYLLPLKKEIERLTQSVGESDPKKKRVFVLEGNSKTGFLPNAVKLQTEMEAILREIPKESKIYIVGHSKGAVESWTMLMNSPQISQERLAGALFLQAPFQGSPFADFVMSGKNAADIETFSADPIQYILRTVLLWRGAKPTYKEAIQDMTTRNASNHVERVLDHQGKDKQGDFWSKTLFLWTKHQTPTLLKYFFPPNNAVMDTCARALTKISGNPNNDGFVMVPNAQLPVPLQERTLVLDGFHHSGFDVGRAGRALGRALFLSNP